MATTPFGVAVPLGVLGVVADMADEEAKQEEAAGETQTVGKLKAKLLAAKQALVKKWLPTLLIGSVVAHGLLWSLRDRGAVETKPFGEVTLGEFEFLPPPGSHGLIERADFQLHISLLQDVETKARARLAERQFKVKQDVEALLRQAHGGDFDDPELSELKRQLQEQINASLELRAIAEVIITDLDIAHSDEEKSQYPVSTDAPPYLPKPGAPLEWQEAPSS
jgi:hypothetical protein